MIILQRGDLLPSVAQLQLQLNALREASRRRTIAVDGDFGGETESAVCEFQEEPAGIAATGVFDPDTMMALHRHVPILIVSCVDANEAPRVAHAITPDMATIQPLRRYGADPVIQRNTLGGIRAMVDGVLHRANRDGPISLLRLYGHGAPGLMGVSGGRGRFFFGDGREDFIRPSQNARISLDNIGEERTANALARIAPRMEPWGAIELHGCNVGAQTKGRKLLEAFADLLGVPTSAGMVGQISGGGGWISDTELGGDRSFRFEGPVRTVCPNGVSLRDWAASLPPISITAIA